MAEKQRAENAAFGIGMHPWIPDLPTLLSVVSDSFLLAKRDIFPDDPDLVFDRKFFAERFLREMPIDDLSEWSNSLAEIRRSIEDDPALVRWFDNLAKRVKPAVRGRDQFRPEVLGYKDGCLHIDAAKCGVSDVAGAARLASAILNYDRDDLAFDLPHLVTQRPGWRRLIARAKMGFSRLLGR